MIRPTFVRAPLNQLPPLRDGFAFSFDAIPGDQVRELANSQPGCAQSTDTVEARNATLIPAFDHVRFSNRPVGVKRFQTIHRCSVDVAHGLMLLFGIGTKALPLWDSKTGRNNLWAALPSDDGRSKRTYDLASSIVPRGTSFHHSVELGFSPLRLSFAAFRLLRRSKSSGTRCHQPTCGA